MRNLNKISISCIRNLMLVTASAMACGTALAQWQWLDASGRKVYSDTAPPQNTPAKNILKRPGVTALAPTSKPDAQPTSPSDKPTGVDPKLEAKRKATEAEEEAKRKADADKIAKAREENCTRAKSSKSTIQLGIRIQTVNAKGEREFMDDKARETESKRLDSIIASDCGPLPTKSSTTPGVSRP